MTTLQFILIAAFGSAVQEIIHLYDIRNTLHLPSTTAILKSWKYWAITLAMIIASGIGTWLLYGDKLTIKSVILILGAAFPIIFKKLVANMGNTKQSEKIDSPHLGSFSLKDYFI